VSYRIADYAINAFVVVKITVKELPAQSAILVSAPPHSDRSGDPLLRVYSSLTVDKGRSAVVQVTCEEHANHSPMVISRGRTATALLDVDHVAITLPLSAISGQAA
jgi:hypothetical protein